MRSIKLILFSFVFLVLIGLVSSAVPNPGHGISDFVPTGNCDGKLLQWNNAQTKWECVDAGSGLWVSGDFDRIYYAKGPVGVGGSVSDINLNSSLVVKNLEGVGAKKNAVWAKTNDVNGIAIYGKSSYRGIVGENDNGNYGWLGSQNYGVYGYNSNGNKGYLGGAYGVYGYSPLGYAGKFDGAVRVSGGYLHSTGQIETESNLFANGDLNVGGTLNGKYLNLGDLLDDSIPLCTQINYGVIFYKPSTDYFYVCSKAGLKRLMVTNP